MTLELLRAFLGWCTVINLGLLALWLLFFTQLHDWMHRLHSRWFELSRERFDSLHYAGMALLKMATLFFNLVPYLVLRLILP
jgi:hypothetical protein